MKTKSWWEDFVRVSAEVSGKSEEEIWKRVPGWSDSSGDLLVKDMDEAGIDKSVILAVDMGPFWGVSSDLDVDGNVICLDNLHKIIAKAVENHPTRLIMFAGIDPRRPDPVGYLKRAVKEWDIKGVKLHPAYGFYPNDPMCYKIYAKMEELGLVLLSHTGPEDIPMWSNYASPMYFDGIANDFRGLKIVMGHAGLSYWEQAATLCSMKPNLYVDVAWWQNRFLRNPVELFYKPLRQMIDLAGSRKILFGSDWPALRQVRRCNPTAWVKAFKEPSPEVKTSGIEFTEQEIKRIMGDNAASVLGIKP
jgi:predicted TIM-barrel fold metal-dependent hydrolase